MRAGGKPATHSKGGFFMANAMPEYGGTVLRPGASGPDIALVQRWLGGLNVDGRYGTSTRASAPPLSRVPVFRIPGYPGDGLPGWKI